MNRYVLSLFAVLAASAPCRSDACAPAPPPGQQVTIAAEEALIVWDPQTKTEHFVRRAQFQSTAKDFGFLVPTPTRPTLAEAPGEVFERLHEATRPIVKVESELEPHFSCLSTMVLSRGAKSAAVEAQSPVQVLAIEHVAGYEAAILQADEAEPLRQWLQKNGYEARPTLVDWLKPYVANKWIVTAFKIADKTGTGRPASSAVRMTFPTDKPFYPYREPSDQAKEADGPRVLRVFFASSAGRVSGTVTGRAWSGELRYARRTAGLGTLLAGALPAGVIADTAWLHDFVDSASPRPGTDDLFFGVDAVQTEVVPPTIVHKERNSIYIPIDVVTILGLGALLVVRLTRKRESS